MLREVTGPTKLFLPQSHVGGCVRRISGWIIAGSIAALVACWWGPLRFLLYAPPGYLPDGDAITISVWLGWLWIAIFAGALYFVRWRALWLLPLAPFALYWPAMWIFVAHGCDLIGRCR
jgi:hypothetical protein